MQSAVFKHFQNFLKFRTAFQQLIYYIRLFFICQELFQKFFRGFWSRSFKIQTFLTAVSFETAYLLYQTEIRLSRTFFVLFKPLFSSTASPLSDSFNRIPQQSPSCQQDFSVFFKFRNRDITPITSKVRKSILFMRQTPSRSPPWPVSVSQSHLSQPRFSLFS